MLEERTYTAGLYLRLSKDDDGRNESVSIGTLRQETVLCLANQLNHCLPQARAYARVCFCVADLGLDGHTIKKLINE